MFDIGQSKLPNELTEELVFDANSLQNRIHNTTQPRREMATERRFQVKQSKIGSIKVDPIYVIQCCVLLYHQYNVRTLDVGLMGIEIE